uniref:CCHC-type domain-containing protein n=1 Tax=Tanacetum cinerariifolium TaxID=118510 RepID=A0A699I255_TANCI|nr:hypothetical protein [Tanacetum cinerariifolium]
MSRDVLTIGSTIRIPLLYRGEYSHWSERFMNYIEEQMDGEAMINSIKNDKSMWSDQEKKIQKIDRLAISLLIQGLLNDIYLLIDSNKTAKDLWDALARQMLGSEYGKQDRKAAVLKEKVVSFDSEGSDEDDFSELKKYVKSDDKKKEKKVDEKKRYMSKFMCYNCKKECHFAKDCKKAKVKDYEYYKTKMLLSKKDKDEQVLLAEDHAWMTNKIAKDLWDALAWQMLGSEYGKQDRKVAVLYEYEMFKATEGELWIDTYIRYLQVINDLKICGYSKDNCEFNFKFLNNLQLE